MWDNFEYPAGALLTNNGWTAFSSGGVNAVQVSPGSLSYNGYFSSGYGNSVQLSSAGGEDVGINFIMCISGSVYCAFLVKVLNVTPRGEYFFHFGTSTSGTDVRGRVFVKAVTGGITFGISKSNRPALYSSSVYPIDSVYLIVLKYTFIPPAVDRVVPRPGHRRA